MIICLAGRNSKQKVYNTKLPVQLNLIGILYNLFSILKRDVFFSLIARL